MDSQVTLCCGAIVIALASCGADELPCRLPAGTDVLECMELDVTFYFAREGDLDCDGVTDGVDPDPLHFEASHRR